MKTDWAQLNILCKNSQCSGIPVTKNKQKPYRMNYLGKRFPDLHTFQCPSCESVRILSAEKGSYRDIPKHAVGTLRCAVSAIILALILFVASFPLSSINLSLMSMGLLMAGVAPISLLTNLETASPGQRPYVLLGAASLWLFAIGLGSFFDPVSLWKAVGHPGAVPTWWENLQTGMFWPLCSAAGIILAIFASHIVTQTRKEEQK